MSTHIVLLLSTLLFSFTFSCNSSRPTDNSEDIDPTARTDCPTPPSSHHTALSRIAPYQPAALSDPRVVEATSLQFERTILSSTLVEVVLRPFPDLTYTLTAIRMPSQENFSVELTMNLGTRELTSSGQLSQDALSNVVIGGALDNSYLLRRDLIMFVPPLYSTIATDGVDYYLLLTSPWFAFLMLKRLESELELSIDEFLPGAVID